MEIRIGGYVASSHLLEREPGRWNSVIIFESGGESTGYAETQSLSCLSLRFDDMLDAQPPKILPSLHEIRRGLEFAEGKDRVLVSCRAGQGRSAALAYLIACRDRGRRRQSRSSTPPDTAPIGSS